MSILSRAFVILVTVLSVVLVALIVPWSAKVQNANDKIASLTTELRTKSSQVQTLQAEQSQTDKYWDEQIKRVQATVTLAENDIKSLQANVDSVRRERDDALAQQRQVSSDLTRVTSIADQQIAIIDSLKNELLQVTPDLVNLGREVAQLNDALLEARSQSEQAARQVRLIQEQSAQREAELGRAIAFLNEKGFPGPDIAEGNFKPEEDERGGVSTPDPAIRGQVTAVQRTPAGITLAAVNVGANDRVQDSMRFMVYRGDTFKGFLDVQDVRNRDSTGRISNPAGGTQVEAGDSVYAGPMPPR